MIMGGNDIKQPKCVRTKRGFYQYHPLPTDEELRDYYANKYYQEGRGSYEVSYSDEEISWFRLKSSLIYKKVARLVPDGRKKVIDVGCGEGWLLAEFHQRGHSVRGLDFSNAGIEKFHPQLLPFFEKGNLYELLKNEIRSGVLFDIISLCNVIEHVKYPVKLLEDVRKMMHPSCVLIIVAPNDFSLLHEYLMKKHILSEKWWLCYPDHLSYFNKESMCNLLRDLDFEIRSIVADNPIDLNLLNENSNYIRDKTKGKNTHLFRVRADNFLGGIDKDKLLALYEILGSMGVGRNLTYYCSLKV